MLSWLSDANNSNRFKQTYVSGFADISGNLIVRNGRTFLLGDSSFNGNVYANTNLTVNKKMYVLGDASFGGNLVGVRDASFGGNLTVSGNLTVAGPNSEFRLKDVVLQKTGVISGNTTLTTPINQIYQITDPRDTFINLPRIQGSLLYGSEITFYKTTSASNSVTLLANDGYPADGIVTYGTVTPTATFVMPGAKTSVKFVVTANTWVEVGSSAIASSDGSFTNMVLQGNLFALRNASFGGNLTLLLDASFGGNLKVSGNTTFSAGKTITMNSNILANTKTITPEELSYLDNLSENIQTKFTNLSNIEYDSGTSTTTLSSTNTNISGTLTTPTITSANGVSVKLLTTTSYAVSVNFGVLSFTAANPQATFQSFKTTFYGLGFTISKIDWNSILNMPLNSEWTFVLQNSTNSNVILKNNITSNTGGTYIHCIYPFDVKIPNNYNNGVMTIRRYEGSEIIVNAYEMTGGSGGVIQSVLDLSNSWVGTNVFNTSLPTSILNPSLGTQLVTKTYVDGLIPAYLQDLVRGITDASFGGNLSVLKDASFGSNLTVVKDASFGGNLKVSGLVRGFADASFGGNLFVLNDASFGSNLTVVKDASFGGNLKVSGLVRGFADASFGGNLFVLKDASFGSNLTVVKDASFGGNLKVSGLVRGFADASFGGNLFVLKDASFGSNLTVGKDAIVNGNLYTNNIYGNGDIEYRDLFSYDFADRNGNREFKNLITGQYDAGLTNSSGEKFSTVAGNVSTTSATTEGLVIITTPITIINSFTMSMDIMFKSFPTYRTLFFILSSDPASSYNSIVNTSYNISLSINSTGNISVGSRSDSIFGSEDFSSQLTTNIQYNIVFKINVNYTNPSSSEYIIQITPAGGTSANSTIFFNNNNITKILTFRRIQICREINNFNYSYDYVLDNFKFGTYVVSTVNVKSILNVSKDATFSGNVNMVQSATVGNATVSGLVRGFTDASFGGNLFVLKDASFGSNLTVIGDASFGGNLKVSGLVRGFADASFGGNLFVLKDASFGSNLTVVKDASFGGNLKVSGLVRGFADASFGGNLFVLNDASFGSNLTVVKDASFGGNLKVSGLVRGFADASFGGNLFVLQDASFGGNLKVSGLVHGFTDASFGGNLFVQKNMTLGNVVLTPANMTRGNAAALETVGSTSIALESSSIATSYDGRYVYYLDNNRTDGTGNPRTIYKSSNYGATFSVMYNYTNSNPGRRLYQLTANQTGNVLAMGLRRDNNTGTDLLVFHDSVVPTPNEYTISVQSLAKIISMNMNSTGSYLQTATYIDSTNKGVYRYATDRNAPSTSFITAGNLLSKGAVPVNALFQTQTLYYNLNNETFALPAKSNTSSLAGNVVILYTKNTVEQSVDGSIVDGAPQFTGVISASIPSGFSLGLYSNSNSGGCVANTVDNSVKIAFFLSGTNPTKILKVVAVSDATTKNATSLTPTCFTSTLDIRAICCGDTGQHLYLGTATGLYYMYDPSPMGSDISNNTISLVSGTSSMSITSLTCSKTTDYVYFSDSNKNMYRYISANNVILDFGKTTNPGVGVCKSNIQVELDVGGSVKMDKNLFVNTLAVSNNQMIHQNRFTFLGNTSLMNPAGLYPESIATSYDGKNVYYLDQFAYDEFASLIKNKPPWGIYTPGDYSSADNRWYEARGNGRNAITVGVSKSSASGNGATATIDYVSGSTTATITWPAGSIPETFTLFTIARRVSANGTIFVNSGSGGANWVHGWVDDTIGRVFYNKSIGQTQTNITKTNWIVLGGRNKGTTAYNAIVNNVSFGDGTDGVGNLTLGINIPTWTSGRTSEFQVSDVLIWDQALTDAEMTLVSARLMQYLTNGVSLNQLYKNADRLNINRLIRSLNYGQSFSEATLPVLSGNTLTTKIATNNTGSDIVFQHKKLGTSTPYYAITYSSDYGNTFANGYTATTLDYNGSSVYYDNNNSIILSGYFGDAASGVKKITPLSSTTIGNVLISSSTTYKMYGVKSLYYSGEMFGFLHNTSTGTNAPINFIYYLPTSTSVLFSAVDYNGNLTSGSASVSGIRNSGNLAAYGMIAPDPTIRPTDDSAASAFNAQKSTGCSANTPDGSVKIGFFISHKSPTKIIKVAYDGANMMDSCIDISGITITGVCCSENGQHLYAATTNGLYYILDTSPMTSNIANNKPLFITGTENMNTTAITCSRTGEYVYFATSNGATENKLYRIFNNILLEYTGQDSDFAIKPYTGNVGIRNRYPLYELDVGGTVNISNRLLVGADSTFVGDVKLSTKNALLCNQSISANNQTLTFGSAENVNITSTSVTTINLPTGTYTPNNIGTRFTFAKTYDSPVSITVSAPGGMTIRSKSTNVQTYAFSASETYLQMVCIASGTTGTTWMVINQQSTGGLSNLTSDDTDTTCYIPFSKTTNSTENQLYIDNTTTPLTYNPSLGNLRVPVVQITSTTASTSATSGSLIVSGGAGISGNMNISGKMVITDPTTTTPSPTDGTLVIKHTTPGGVSSIVFPSAANYTSDYAYITYQDNRGSGENALLTIGTSNDADDDIKISSAGSLEITSIITKITSTAESASTITGALVVSGGVGIGGKAYIGGDTKISSATTSTSATSGALQVAGGVGISGNVYLSQDIYLSTKNALLCNQSISANNQTLTFGSAENVNITSASVTTINLPTGTYTTNNIGTRFTFAKTYDSPVSITVSAPGGMTIRSKSTNVQTYAFSASETYLQMVCIGTTGTTWMVINQQSTGGLSNLTSDNTNTTCYIPFSKTTNATENQLYINNDATFPLAYNPSSGLLSVRLISTTNGGDSNSINEGSIRTASLGVTQKVNIGGDTKISSASASISTNTGALVVSGGVGIVGKAYIGGDTNITSATASTSTNTGALVVSGGVGIVGKAYIGGDTNITSATASTSTNTGALVVSGGVGIVGKAYIGGDTKISSATTSTSATSGALQVAGGVGISGNMNISGKMVITDPTTTTPSPTDGTLVIKHTTPGGVSSIVFPSAANYNNDYAYITYQDNRGSGENSLLTIGTSNDPDDDIKISSAGSLEITSITNITSATASTSTSTGALVVSGGAGIAKALFVGGVTTASGFNATSDRRLKQDIRGLSSQWENIKRLRPSEYMWASTGTLDYGFVAQEVFGVYPHMRQPIHSPTVESSTLDEPVSSDGKPQYYALDYGKMTTMLCKGLQEAMNLIEAQQIEIAELKQKMEEFIDFSSPSSC